MPFFHLFSTFTSHLETIVAQGGYVFLFFITALEGIPLVGMAIPGHITIVIAGFLAKIGTLDLYWVLAIGVAGAILGDFIAFSLGRKYGLKFIDRLRPYFFITDQHIDKARGLLAKHTGKAMIIGRFSPVTRPLMPFLVGASETPVHRFWLFNIIGAVSWIVSSVFIGYIFGAGYHAAAGYFGKFSVFAIIVGLIILWGYRFVNIRFHLFKKYELFVLILNVISLYTLAKAIEDAWSPRSFMANFDIYVSGFMDMLTHAHAWIVPITKLVTTAGDMSTVICLSLVVFIYLSWKKRWRSAALMLVSITSTSFVTGTMKAFFMRARPDNALINLVNDPSFPSGHASMAAAFFVILAYLLVRHIHSWVWREIVIALSVIAVIAIGLSRLVLNVHWASDVIAGWALGVFLATATILLVRYVGFLVVRKG